MKMRRMNHMRYENLTRIVLVVTGVTVLGSCSSSMKVKQHDYGSKRSEWTIKQEFPQVWKGIEEAVYKMKVSKRKPKHVSPVEMKRLKKRHLETAWSYSRSKDKYVEFKVNGFPEKKYLQTRMKYQIEAERTLGGTHVKVGVKEEIEKLKSDGSPAGYSQAKADPALAQAMLERIKNATLSELK